MSFPLQENFGFLESASQFEPGRISSRKQQSSLINESKLHICAEKIRVPEFEKTFRLPRLLDLLEKSSHQFSATMITGRSGTGKTALAAEFTRGYEHFAWYSIESADCDWKVFSGYLAASILGEEFEQTKFLENLGNEPQQTVISRYFTNIFTNFSEKLAEKPFLIVLDDLHHIFDCDWFNDFFNLFLHSLLPNTHLLLLSRSKPALPLWRLRSKQVLNVIDEKLLALNHDEIQEFCEKFGIQKEKAQQAFRDSFGRISKLINLTE